MLMAFTVLLENLVTAGFEILNVGTSGQMEALFQGSGFQQQKFHFRIFMVCLCGPTTIWKVGTTEWQKEHESTTWGFISYATDHR
ncbi:hypothetical protein T07_3710 [Trichinella nelsoni]|uniref:Uncharacterized protein n=1 Tax=Trichinella nelsoni TaxID=6336 RepID=A0A0V0RGH5_9BILA|nr:hypothetical protein T07_3710 [Trichinella nelsoni]